MKSGTSTLQEKVVCVHCVFFFWRRLVSAVSSSFHFLMSLRFVFPSFCFVRKVEFIGQTNSGFFKRAMVEACGLLDVLQHFVLFHPDQHWFLCGSVLSFEIWWNITRKFNVVCKIYEFICSMYKAQSTKCWKIKIKRGWIVQSWSELLKNNNVK